jgi:uncharacterized membrane protein
MILRHVKTHLARGLLLVLPTIVTLWLLRILFGIVSDNVTPLVLRVLAASGATWIETWHARLVVPLIGVVLTMLLVYLIGLIAANLVGQKLLAMIERGIGRVPFVKSIYGGTRQLLDAFGAGNRGTFSRVVLAEYPRTGLWTIGFVTIEAPIEIPAGEKTIESVMVFFPTTPNPTSGWLALVPKSDLLEIEVSIEEAVKLIVSGGIVAPASIAAKIRRLA